MSNLWETAGQGLKTPHVDGFWTSGHDQMCPHAKIEKFETLQRVIERQIAKEVLKGKLFVGLVGVPTDFMYSFAVSNENRAKILEFHLLQRAVQVLKNKSHKDPEFLKGLTVNNSLNIVDFSAYSYSLIPQWVPIQLAAREEFMKKYADEIATIREHFDIDIKELARESRDDYSAGSSEKICLYVWLGAFLKPKKAINEGTNFGSGDLHTNLEAAWEEEQRVFESRGVRMPNAPKPVKVVVKKPEVVKPAVEKEKPQPVERYERVRN